MPHEQVEDRVVVDTPDGFNAEVTLDSGQCFRYDRLNENTYYVVAHGRILYITQQDGKTILHPCTVWEYENVWKEYLDFSRDYSKIRESLSTGDDYMAEAISIAPGIRIIKQDNWECLISFIISANNRIPMIKQVVKNLSQKFGESIDGGTYSFPTPERLAQASISDIMECKAGFRAKYILSAAQMVHSQALDLCEIDNLPSDDLRRALMQVNGVGAKVADCVMLLSYARGDVFPIDVWIRRIMQEHYFLGKEIPLAKIQDFARQKWGNNAGYANQFLFNFARLNKVGAK